MVGSSIDTVKVTIKTKKENTQTISNIPIEIKGIDEEKYEVKILDPSNGMVDLAIEGEESKIKSLKSSDFDIFIANIGCIRKDSHLYPSSENCRKSIKINQSKYKNNDKRQCH